MEYMKGFEEGADADIKYERTILRVDLREPMAELCPLSVNNEGSVKKTDTVRLWMGWLPFDVHVCKFELEQWLAAHDVNLSENRNSIEERAANI